MEISLMRRDDEDLAAHQPSLVSCRDLIMLPARRIQHRGAEPSPFARTNVLRGTE